jgi:hypothetical protein
MTRWRGTLLGVVATVGVAALSGCGSVYYAININAAEARLEQAREMGAEKQAPYENYYAREHLREARIHASEASYGDAANFAETAETYAQKAIDKMGNAKRGDDVEGKSDKDTDDGWEK